MKFGMRSNTYLTQNKNKTKQNKKGHSISPIPFDRTVYCLALLTGQLAWMDSERTLLKDSF